MSYLQFTDKFNHIYYITKITEKTLVYSKI